MSEHWVEKGPVRLGRSPDGAHFLRRSMDRNRNGLFGVIADPGGAHSDSEVIHSNCRAPVAGETEGLRVPGIPGEPMRRQRVPVCIVANSDDVAVLIDAPRYVGARLGP